MSRTRKLLVAAAVPAVLALIAWLGWSAWSRARLDAAIARWEAERGPLEDTLARFPETGPNEVALELERLAMPLGITLAPTASDRPAAAHPLDRHELRDFSAYVASETEAPAAKVAAPPPAALAFLEMHEAEIDALVVVVLDGESPRWETHAGLGVEAPLPNTLGHLWLQRILATSALHDIGSGRPDRAEHTLEAAWRLGEAMRARPEAMAILIDFAATRHRLAVLRKLPEPSPQWHDRLRPSAREAARAVLAHDAWSVAAACNDLATLETLAFTPTMPAWHRLIRGRLGLAILRPELRLRAAESVDQTRIVLAADEAAGKCWVPPAGATARLPVSPMEDLLQNLTFGRAAGSILQRAARADYEADMTRAILEARAVRQPGIIEGSCPRWRFRVEVLADGRVQVAAEGQPPPPPQRVAELSPLFVEAWTPPDP